MKRNDALIGAGGKNANITFAKWTPVRADLSRLRCSRRRQLMMMLSIVVNQLALCRVHCRVGLLLAKQGRINMPPPDVLLCGSAGASLRSSLLLLWLTNGFGVQIHLLHSAAADFIRLPLTCCRPIGFYSLAAIQARARD